MARKRHKSDTKSFDELTFAVGSRSINATIANLERAIQNNVGKSATPIATKQKCIDQLQRLLRRI